MFFKTLFQAKQLICLYKRYRKILKKPKSQFNTNLSTLRHAKKDVYMSSTEE